MPNASANAATQSPLSSARLCVPCRWCRKPFWTFRSRRRQGLEELEKWLAQYERFVTLTRAELRIRYNNASPKKPVATPLDSSPQPVVQPLTQNPGLSAAPRG